MKTIKKKSITEDKLKKYKYKLWYKIASFLALLFHS